MHLDLIMTRQKEKEQGVPEEVVINKIHILRGYRVMLDKDLAEMYGVKPIRLREQLKRNIDRFPANFMFQLTDEEVDAMVSQFAIPSKRQLGGARPYVFTEHGVLMLANVLKSERAILMSIKIIEVFVKLREITLMHKDILLKLEQIENTVGGHDKQLSVLFEAVRELITKPDEERKRVEGFRARPSNKLLR